MNSIERRMRKKMEEKERNGKRRSPSRYGSFRRKAIHIDMGQLSSD